MPRRVHTYPVGRRLGLAEPALLDRRLHPDDGLCAGRWSTSILQFRFGKPFRRNPWSARHAGMGAADARRPPTISPRCRWSTDARRHARPARDRAASWPPATAISALPATAGMETLGVDMTTGRPDQVDRAAELDLPAALVRRSPSAPSCCACCSSSTGCRSLPLAVTLVLLPCLDAATGLRARSRARSTSATAMHAPPHYEADGAPSWWGMVFLLACNGTLYRLADLRRCCSSGSSRPAGRRPSWSRPAWCCR